MSKRILLKLSAAILALGMMLSAGGCASLFADLAVDQNASKEEDPDLEWGGKNTRRVEVVNEYNNGLNQHYRDAFYIDESKAVKTEIEEFHLVGLASSYTVYYYTATANPSNSSATGTGYYCLAAYDFEAGIYRVLLEGYYDKENGNAAFAYDVYNPQGSNMGGSCFGCIGNNSYFDLWLGSYHGDDSVYSVSIFDIFYISEGDQETIEDAVGGPCVCIDIALIDNDNRRLAAAYMNVEQLEEETEDEDTTATIAVFDIEFDDSEEDIVHDVDLMRRNVPMDIDNVISSAIDHATEFSGVVYTYNYEEDAKGISMYRNTPIATLARKAETIFSDYRNRDESLESFTVRLFDDMLYIYFLFDDRIAVSSATMRDDGRYSYSYAGKFNIVPSETYISFDDCNSIDITDSEHIYACSMSGLYDVELNEEAELLLEGAYYAMGTTDGKNYTLIGFPETTHNVTTNTYINDELVSSKSEQVEYSINDMPFAKVYKTEL